MKIPYYISLGVTGVCLVLSIVIFAVGNSNYSLQKEVQEKQVVLQTQQQQINEGATIQQKYGPALLQDMGGAALKNEKMKALLGRHGIQVNTPSPSATPAGATPTPR